MGELPDDVVAEAERLTRLARRAVDPDEATAYRGERDRLLSAHGFVARVREEEARNVLVCYPDEWIEEGAVRTDRIDDLARATERPLDGTGDEGEWEAVEAHNREIAAAVEEAAGPVHGANASAFADFMGNHYVRRVGSATDAELREFLAEYFPRNVWPTDAQREAVEESLQLVLEAADGTPPGFLERDR